MLITLWSGAGVLVAGVVAVLFLLAQSGSGPAHVIATPAKVGNYVSRPGLEQQTNTAQLQREMVAKSAGQVSHVVSAVYEDNAGVSSGSAPQMILFVGGHLSGVSPGDFISTFTGQFKGAKATGAGPLGGSAACVSTQSSVLGSVALCTWADNDTFGVVASPTMAAAKLAAQMRILRTGIEHVAR